MSRSARSAFSISLLAGLSGGFLATPVAADPVSRPDTFLARLETLAAMETLDAEILGARSATKVLESWCATHAMAAEPVVRARRVDGPETPPSVAQRQRLGIGPDEPVRYRNVRLTCGDHVLSEADNWYVPARLTPAMNHALETTDTSFGTVVAPLHPTRQTFAAEVRWQVLPPGWEMRPPPPDQPGAPLAIPHILFEHHALLYDAERRPFSEVDEHYTSEILAFGRGR